MSLSRRLAGGLAILAVVSVAVSAGALAAPRWQLLGDESRLGFVFILQGDEKAGHFQRFDADIVFDPEDLDASQVTVDIDLASVRAGADDRNGMLAEKDWFHVKAHPSARFQTTGFKALGGERYEAAARLTIKGIGQDVVLPFSLVIEDEIAHVVGALTFKRTLFDVGAGGWSKDDVVGLPVTVKVDIKARRLPDAP